MKNLIITVSERLARNYYKEYSLSVIILCSILYLGWQGNNFLHTFERISSDTDAGAIEKKHKPAFVLKDFQPIFGIAGTETNVQRQIPRSSLNLKLKGVLAGNRHSASSAIIEDNKGMERVYKPGDKLFEGITLHQVFSTYAIIRNRGVLQKIIFTDNTQNTRLQLIPHMPIDKLIPEAHKGKK